MSDGIRESLSLSLALRHSAFEVSRYNLPQHKTLRSASAGQSVAWLGQNPLASFALAESERLFPQAMQLPLPMAVDGQSAIDQVAARYKSQHATSLVSSNGWGENPALRLGSVLNVTGEGLGTDASGEESFGKYLVTSLSHTVDGSNMYENLFEAVPSSAEHPPLGPHRKSPVGQPELAEVIDQKDPLHLGRVRVRYYWGVAKPIDAESDWLRVSTPYSGAGKGYLFTPELGSQVLVGYEHNQAEQPLILGNLFHPRNKQGAKYSTPDNHLKGMQTAGGNKVVMSDKKGAQTILLSNSNNKGTAVEIGFKGDGSITIKSNGPVTVLSPNITLEAGEKGAIKMHAKNITIEAEENIDLKSGKEVNTKTTDFKVEADKSVSVEGKNSAKLAGTVKTDIEGGMVTVSGQQMVDVKGMLVKINS